MKTIRLALTDNKDFRLVNVELPGEPKRPSFGEGNHSADRYVRWMKTYHEKVKRLVDSCPVVSMEGVYLDDSTVIQTEPYKIYELKGWIAWDDVQWEVYFKATDKWINCSPGDAFAYKEEGQETRMHKIISLSKVESEEKEEPKLYSISELETRAIDFLVWYTGMPEDKVRVSYDHFLREQGF